MTLFRLAWANLRIAPLSNTLNVSLLALGTATVVILLLLSQQMSSVLSRDAKNIDLVVGAKGSPVQLVMSSVYHADIPTGNIPLQEVLPWAKDRRIAQAVPLSLGDSAAGFRLVGTTPAFLSLYDASLQAGELWQQPFDAVLGAAAARAMGLAVGDSFTTSHGMAGHGNQHEKPYTVSGILNTTGTVADRLILTGLRSVWAAHGGHHEKHAHKQHNHDATPSDEHNEHQHHSAEQKSPDRLSLEQLEEAAYAEQDITAMLLKYRSAIAAVSMPRQINAQSSLQAAAPAFELARLINLMGLGFQGLKAFAGVLIGLALFSVFAALYTAMQARRGELAMMRCLGATRFELMVGLLIEGLLLGVAGTLLGLLIGHGVVELLAISVPNGRALGLTGFVMLSEEFWLVAALLVIYSAAALLPAWQAYRTDVARSLSTSGFS